MDFERVVDGVPDVFWATITPEAARDILSNPLEENGVVQQRNVRVPVVDLYGVDMAEGRWRMDECTPIKLNRRYGVVDGQHRLHAIVKSGTAQTMLVALAINQDAAYYDSANPKKAGHILQMRGEKFYSQLGSVLGKLWILDNGGFRGLYRIDRQARPMSTSEVIPTLERHPDVREDVAWAQNRHKRFAPMGLPGTMVATFAYVTRNLDPDVSGEFFAKLLGAGGEPKDPVMAMRNVLISNNEKLRRTNSRINSEIYLATMVKAWNHLVNGDKISSPRMFSPTKEKWPIPIDPSTMMPMMERHVQMAAD